MAELVLIAAAVAGLVWFGWRAIKRAAGRMADLAVHGHEAQAYVSKVEKKRLSRTDDAYIVTYEFTANDGRQYSRELNVKPSEFENFQQGQNLEIVYDTRNPEVSALKASVDEVRKLQKRSHIR